MEGWNPVLTVVLEFGKYSNLQNAIQVLQSFLESSAWNYGIAVPQYNNIMDGGNEDRAGMCFFILVLCQHNQNVQSPAHLRNQLFLRLCKQCCTP